MFHNVHKFILLVVFLKNSFVYLYDMQRNNFFRHNGSDGSLPWDRVGETVKWSGIGENLATGKTVKRTVGVIIRGRTKKNRIIPEGKEAEFHISFHKGMNPFVGLEQYVSWDTCGVGRGVIVTQKEFEVGYHYKPTPEEAVQGLALLQGLREFCPPPRSVAYPDLRTITIKN
jgi:hypothetical protein